MGFDLETVPGTLTATGSGVASHTHIAPHKKSAPGKGPHTDPARTAGKDPDAPQPSGKPSPAGPTPAPSKKPIPGDDNSANPGGATGGNSGAPQPGGGGTDVSQPNGKPPVPGPAPAKPGEADLETGKINVPPVGDPQGINGANGPDPVSTLRSIAALQKNAQNKKSSDFPDALVEALSKIGGVEIVPSSEGTGMAVNYGNVRFSLQRVANKFMVVASGTMGGPAIRQISYELLQKLNAIRSTAVSVDAEHEPFKINDNLVTVNVGPGHHPMEIEFPVPQKREAMALHRSSEGHLLLNPEKLRSKDSAERQFMEITQLLDRTNGHVQDLQGKLEALEKTTKLDPRSDCASVKIETDTLESIVHLLEDSVEAPNRDREDPSSILGELAASLSDKLQEASGETLRRKIFENAQTTLDGILQSRSGGTLLRAIRASGGGNVQSVIALHRALGGTWPSDISAEHSSRIVEMGRDVCAISRESDNGEAMARLLSDQHETPIALWDGSTVTIAKGYAEDCLSISSSDEHLIPGNAIIMERTSGKWAKYGDEFRDNAYIMDDDGGTKRVFGELESTITSLSRTIRQTPSTTATKTTKPKPAATKSKPVARGFVPTDTIIGDKGWEEHRTNGNCAIFSIRDSAAMVADKRKLSQDEESNFQALRSRASHRARQEIERRIEAITHDRELARMEAQKLLDLVYARAKKKKYIPDAQDSIFTSGTRLLETNRDQPENDDKRAILAAYKKLNGSDRGGLDDKTVISLCDLAFSAITLGTDRAWLEVEDLRFVAQAMNRTIVVLDTQGQQGDSGAINFIQSYRVIDGEGNETMYKVKDDGSIDSSQQEIALRSEAKKTSKSRNTPLKLPHNAIIVTKFSNHFMGAPELTSPYPSQELYNQSMEVLGLKERGLPFLLPETVWEDDVLPEWLGGPIQPSDAEPSDDEDWFNQDGDADSEESPPVEDPANQSLMPKYTPMPPSAIVSPAPQLDEPPASEEGPPLQSSSLDLSKPPVKSQLLAATAGVRDSVKLPPLPPRGSIPTVPPGPSQPPQSDALPLGEEGEATHRQDSEPAGSSPKVNPSAWEEMLRRAQGIEPTPPQTPKASSPLLPPLAGKSAADIADQPNLPRLLPPLGQLGNLAKPSMPPPTLGRPLGTPFQPMPGVPGIKPLGGNSPLAPVGGLATPPSALGTAALGKPLEELGKLLGISPKLVSPLGGNSPAVKPLLPTPLPSRAAGKPSLPPTLPPLKPAAGQPPVLPLLPPGQLPSVPKPFAPPKMEIPRLPNPGSNPPPASDPSEDTGK
ncbi:MAG: hypothetical protein LBJ94_02245 [Puniceicoccales bacterium]|nr:hypothetical protein [Puniceicoccales bacterium]